jgi:hypothetical protein
MATRTRRSPDLELELLRKGVGALAAGRPRCVDCERTPLVGERVHEFEGGRLVCELCRPLRAGEPLATEVVRHSEHGHAVRLTVRRAA